MNERILVVLNKSGKDQQFNLTIPLIYDIKTATDIISNDTIPVNENLLLLNINGIGYRIMKLN
jgi:hypothetical protein